MSDRPNRCRPTGENAAAIFAALGDATRLSLIDKLGDGRAVSIARLTQGSKLTRQAVTTHLRVLESAGVVGSRRSGRENLYRLEPAPIAEMRNYLDDISRQWSDTLGRLKAFVEE